MKRNPKFDLRGYFSDGLVKNHQLKAGIPVANEGLVRNEMESPSLKM